jgi:hypothetical protein
MRPALLGLPLSLLLGARADAGQVLKFSEEGTRDGKAYRSTLVLSVAPEGVRAEATDLSSPGGPKTVTYLYVAKDDRILPVDPPTGPVISTATLAVVEARARASGHRRSPGAFSVTPLHSRESSAAWTCEAWAARRPGQTTEIACLADPKALGVDEVTRANLRRMNALFVPFANAVRLAGGDAREAFDAYALAGGFPVHTFRSKDGVVEADTRLVSVENVPLPADLFRAPALAAPAPEVAPKTGAGGAAGRSLSLEAWAARGMPDAGRVWTGADYDAAAGLLEAAAREDAARLPRESSPDSGALYRRFVDPANLAPARGPGPADGRAREGAGILAGADRISLLYAAAYRDDARLGPELAGLMAYTLLAAREVVPLADAAVAAAPKGDTHRAARLASRKRTHEALASVVNAALTSLATRGGFGPAERLRLARALAEHLPALAAYLPPATRRELPARLKTMAAAETDPEVRDALDRARAALLPRAKAA